MLQFLPVRRFSAISGISVFLIFLIHNLFFAASSFAQITSVYTDKPDYLPGDTVIIMGSGWQPGEQVRLDIDHSTVTHGNTVLYTQANYLGEIYNDQYIIQSFHLGETFVLLATGLTSGLTAQTTFTDGNAPTSLTVGSQNGTAVYGTTASVTYLVTVNRKTNGNGNSSFSADLTISGLPPGVSSSFLPSTVFFPDGNTASVTSSLTITTPITANATQGIFTVNATTGTVSAPGSGTLVISPKTVTPFFLVSDKQYDGNTNGNIFLSSLNGLVNNDNVSILGTATFNNAAAGPNKPVTVSGLMLSGPAAGNYILPAPTVNVTASILQKPITVNNIVASNKVYDGTNTAFVSSGSLNGIIGTDQVSLVVGSAVYADKMAGAGKTVTYNNLTLSGSAAGNYRLLSSSFSSTAAIIQKALTISGISANNKTYDRTTDAVLTGIPVLSGMITGDLLNLDMGAATGVFADKNVGTNKPVTATGFALSGADAPNYSLNPISGLSANILPFALTGNVTAANKPYDGSSTANILSRTLSGVFSGDVVSYSGGTAVFNNAAVGTGKTVTASGLSLTGGDAANYSVNSSTTTTADILPKTVTASFTAQNKTYDGTAAANFSGLSLAGVLTADLANVTVSGGPATFSNESVGTGKTVTLANLILSGTAAGNYTLASGAAMATASILAKAISPVITADDKAYDGTTSATFSSRSLAGVISSDVVILSGGSAVFNSKDAGTGKTVTGSGFTLSGPAAGNYTLSPVSATTTASINKKELTPIFTVSNKPYDGNTSANITSRQLNGVVNSENISLSGGTATFDTKDIGTSKTVTGSGFSLAGSTGVVANYVLASTTATTTASITGKQLSPVVTVANKTYDGNTSAIISGRSLTGSLTGDDVILTGGAAIFATKSVGTNKPVSITGLSIAGADAGNYSLASTSASATAAISAMAVIPDFTAENKIYDGTTAATISGRNLTGVLPGDAVIIGGGTATFSDKQAGIGKNVSAGSFTLSGIDAANYVLSPATITSTADITPKPISAGVVISNKVYDGTIDAVISNRTLAGNVNGDAVTLTGGTALFADKNVGNSKPVNITGLALSGADAGNYTLSENSASATANITPKNLTVTGIQASNKEYDATRNATLITSGYNLAGVVSPDLVSLNTGNYVATFGDALLGIAKPVTVSGLTLNGPDAGNYTLSQPANLTADITKKLLTVSVTVNNKVYNGNTTGTLSNQTLSGLITGDNINLVIGSVNFSDKNVGTGKLVTVSGISLGGQDKGNYTVNSTATTTADITPKSVTGIITASDKIYDGTTSATIATSSLSGNVAGDLVSLTSGSATFASKTVGTNKIVTATGLSLSGTDAGNYLLSSTTASTSASITRLGISGSFTAADKVYDRTSGATVLSRSLTGVLANDQVELTGGSAVFSTVAAGQNIIVTLSGAALSGTDAGNYTLNSVANSTANITPLGISGTFTAADKTYDGTTMATVLTRNLTGVLGTDNVSLAGGSVAFADENADVNKMVTLNGATLAGTEAANYSLTGVASSTATINPKGIVISPDANQAKVYGAADPGFTYTASEALLSGNTFSGSLSRVAGETVSGGPYAFTLGTLSAGANYSLSLGGNQTFAITPKSIGITADVKSKTYGDADPALTFTITTGALEAGESFTGTLGRTAGESAGTFSINQGTVLLNSNYSISFTPADLTILPRNISITADAKTKIFGDTDPAFTFKVTSGNLVFSDAFTGNLNRAAGENVGTYAITQGTVEAGPNYNMTFLPADLTISTRAITIAADPKSRTYGDPDPALTFQITSGNLIDSDAFSGSLSRVAGENVGSYIINQGSVTLNSNYTLSYTPDNLTITPRAISVTADAKTKTYGDADPTFTYQISSGNLIGNDAFSGSLSRAAGENVGTYAINVGTLDAGSNYSFTFLPADLTISTRAITIAADPKSRIYGDTDPALTFQIITGSLIGSDAFSGALSRAAGENVGTYAINQGSVVLNNNYLLSYSPANLTISPRNISITADANSKTFGDTDPAFTFKITAGNLVFSDAFTGNLSRAAGENVGAYAITQGTVDAGSNYNLTFLPADLTISTRAITIAADPKSRTYGDTDPALTFQITSGNLIGPDAFSGALSRVAGENVGSYAIQQGSVALSSNYTLSYTPANLTITPRAVSVTADAKNKTYGDADPTFTYQISSGNLIGNNAFSGNLSRAAGENVGTRAILSGSLSLGPNYKLTLEPGQYLTIMPRDVTVTANSGQQKVYGNADPVLTFSVSNGTVIQGDNFSGSLSRAAGENVGTKAITMGTLTLGANYNLSLASGSLFTIIQRNITVAANPGQQKNFGSADPVLTYAITAGSLVPGDNFSGALARDAGEDIGTKPITLGTLTLGNNYDLNLENGAVFRIVPAAPSVAVVAIPNPVQYSDKTTLTATVSSSNATVQNEVNSTGGTVEFYHTFVAAGNLLGQISNSTLSGGKISMDVRINLPQNTTTSSLGVIAVFKPTSQNLSNVTSAASYTLTVIKENAQASYAGLQYFTAGVDASNNYVAKNVELRASFTDTLDGFRGNITRAKAKFTTATATLATGVKLNRISASDSTIAEAVIYKDIPLSQSEITAGGKSFEVKVEAEENYYKGYENSILITVVVPGNDYVNGGGHVVAQNSTGTYAATVNSKINFGFTMKWNKSGKNLMGQANIIFRRLVNGTWRTYQIKSNSINSLGTATLTDGRRADISTKANFTDLTNPSIPVSLGGNMDLTIQALESTNPTVPPMMSVTLRSGTGEILFCNNWVAGKAAMKALGGGSIKVLNNSSVATSARVANVTAAPDKPAVSLFENYPNPFSDATSIRFLLEKEQRYELAVYDIRGALIKKLDAGVAEAGKVYTYDLDGKILNEGIYFVRLITDKGVQTLRAIKKTL